METYPQDFWDSSACLQFFCGNFHNLCSIRRKRISRKDHGIELRNAIHIIALLIFMLSSLAVQSQVKNEGVHVVDAKIALKGAEVQGSFVVISYEIPYSGMVEIRLFNEGGEKIWQNQYADSFGKNSITLKASKFNPGETYAYQLNYKRDQVTKTLVIPPLGFN